MEPLHRLRLSVGSRHIYFAFGVRGISSHLLRIWCPGHELIQYIVAETIFKVYHLM